MLTTRLFLLLLLLFDIHNLNEINNNKKKRILKHNRYAISMKEAQYRNNICVVVSPTHQTMKKTKTKEQ